MVVIPVAQIIYPDGAIIEGEGIEPDKAVQLKQEDLLNGVDTQLQAAVDYLRANSTG